MPRGDNGAKRDLAPREVPDPSAVDQAAEMLLAGETPTTVLDRIREEWPEVDEAALFEAVGARFLRAARGSVDRTVGWALETYRDLYRTAREAGDLTNAIKAVDRLVALKRDHLVLDD